MSSTPDEFELMRNFIKDTACRISQMTTDDGITHWVIKTSDVMVDDEETALLIKQLIQEAHDEFEIEDEQEKVAMQRLRDRYR